MSQAASLTRLRAGYQEDAPVFEDLNYEELKRRSAEAATPFNVFQTNLPGVFAVGDVRSGSVK